MLPASGRFSPMMVRSSTDLPVPEPPTTPSTSPRRTSRSRPSCTVCVAEPVDEAAHPDHDIVGLCRHVQIRSIENRIENTASATITRKIDSTTDWVVSRPTLRRCRSR